MTDVLLSLIIVMLGLIAIMLGMNFIHMQNQVQDIRRLLRGDPEEDE